QQLSRAQRIGHHDGDGQAGIPSGQLTDDFGVRQCREALAPILLGNDQPEEAFGLDVLPCFRREILVLRGDAPVVHQCAKRFGLFVQKRLFLDGEGGAPIRKQHAPLRFTAEELTFPPYGSSVQRFLLGIRDGGHYLAVHPVYASGQVFLSPRFVGEDNSGSDDDDQQQRDKQVHKVSILSSYVGSPGGGPCTIPVNASGGDTSG